MTFLQVTWEQSLRDTKLVRKSPRLIGSFYDNPDVDRVIINTKKPTLVKFSQQFTRKGGIIVDVGLPSDSSFEVVYLRSTSRSRRLKAG
jgi:hypothetical protein